MQMQLAIVLGVSVAACSALMPKTAPSEGRYRGETPVVIVNEADAVIDQIKLSRGEKDVKYGGYRDSTTIYFDDQDRVVSSDDDRHVQQRPMITQGQSATLNLQPGRYVIEIQNLSDETPVDISGPTQIVLYDGEPPTVTAPPGYRTVALETSASKREHARAQLAAQDAATASRDRAQCARELPPVNERPRPGRAKLTGRWTCVVGGAGSGTDYVQLVQLADGKITATLMGADRNTTWQGAVVGGELHFTFTELAAGGRLKIDPSQRAMIGTASVFTGARCLHMTYTCTR